MSNEFLNRNLDMESVAIVYRHYSEEAMEASQDLAQFLSEMDVVVYTGPNQKLIPGTKRMTNSALKSLSFVIVMGGDGTYLKAVRAIKALSIPIIGCNLGSLGFLTPVKKNQIKSFMKKVAKGNIEMRPRSMMNVEHGRSQTSIGVHTALNDIVIDRGAGSRLIPINIYSDDHHVVEARADGLVIASPTGSTAYNLAAGGPVLHPEVKAIVATFLSPHSLTCRPLIFPEERSLRIVLGEDSAEANIHIDGTLCGSLRNGEKLEITQSPETHYIIREKNHDYFDLLRTKLQFGLRG